MPTIIFLNRNKRKSRAGLNPTPDRKGTDRSKGKGLYYFDFKYETKL